MAARRTVTTTEQPPEYEAVRGTARLAIHYDKQRRPRERDAALDALETIVKLARQA